jgi:hypothetical protein
MIGINEQILNVLFKYKLKKNARLQDDFQKWDTFIWSAKTLLKHQIMFSFLHPHLLYLFPNFCNVIL